MPKLIKGDHLIENHWVTIEKDAQPLGEDYLLVHASNWNEQLPRQYSHIGIWLDAGDSISLLPSRLEGISVIAVNFPLFADGRSFSLARQIRDQREYTGELRAIGNFMQDQVFYLKRCGVDSFAVQDDTDIEAFRVIVNSFTDSYQAAVDEPRPLFRRR